MPRIRIVLSAGELDLEGPEEFIERYSETVTGMLGRLTSSVQVTPSKSTGGGAIEKPEATTFGEALHELPKSATGVDQILLAGAFVQAASTDDTFLTVEANKLLTEQGIKLGNASQSVTNNLTGKRVFKIGKKYRVSKIGKEHLAALKSTT